jgi:light-dependent protochlorophyllide reductase
MEKANKTVIVTGGNSGLGFETARAILQAGNAWHVIIAGRSRERCEAAARRLAQESGNQNVEAMALNLASLVSIRRFAAEVSTRGMPPLRALVCNAGVQNVSGTKRTEDQFEATFGVNHLGHFLLANLLLRHVEAPGRIVFVSSGTHDPDQWSGMPAPQLQDVDALAHPKEDSAGADSAQKIGQRRYTTSKLCNVLCAYELARRLESHGQAITVNAFDPGLMPGSGLARDYGAPLRFLWNYVLPLLRLVVKNVNSTQSSGKNLARLILDPGLASVTGKYFVGNTEWPSSRESNDAVKAETLWEGSARLVGLPSVTRSPVAPPA